MISGRSATQLFNERACSVRNNFLHAILAMQKIKCILKGDQDEEAEERPTMAELVQQFPILGHLHRH